jgi:hypothetical protein
MTGGADSHVPEEMYQLVRRIVAKLNQCHAHRVSAESR